MAGHELPGARDLIDSLNAQNAHPGCPYSLAKFVGKFLLIDRCQLTAASARLLANLVRNFIKYNCLFKNGSHLNQTEPCLELMGSVFISWLVLLLSSLYFDALQTTHNKYKYGSTMIWV